MACVKRKLRRVQFSLGEKLVFFGSFFVNSIAVLAAQSLRWRRRDCRRRFCRSPSPSSSTTTLSSVAVYAHIRWFAVINEMSNVDDKQKYELNELNAIFVGCARHTRVCVSVCVG